jgi:hypothetical protein
MENTAAMPVGNETDLLEVEVDCPQCGDVNRAARRLCSFCSKTGRVRKFLPASEA